MKYNATTVNKMVDHANDMFLVNQLNEAKNMCLDILNVCGTSSEETESAAIKGSAAKSWSISVTYSLLGTIEDRDERPEEAIDYYQKSVTSFQQYIEQLRKNQFTQIVDTKLTMSKTLYNISVIYQNLKFKELDRGMDTESNAKFNAYTEKEREFLEKALSILPKNEAQWTDAIKRCQAIIYYNLAKTYEADDNNPHHQLDDSLQHALTWYEHALNSAKSMTDKATAHDTIDTIKKATKGIRLLLGEESDAEEEVVVNKASSTYKKRSLVVTDGKDTTAINNIPIQLEGTGFIV